MEICVLGSLAVRTGTDEDISLGPRLRRVLAVLVASPNRVVPLDQLLDAVWMGEPPAAAEKSLRTYISRLRQALDPTRQGVIEFEGTGYILRLDGITLDSDRFEAELEEATLLHRSADAEGTASVLNTALGRWAGAAYSEFADEDWARPTAVRLDERRLEATELLIEARLMAGDNEQAVAEARQLAEAEPLRERPRGLLMRALYASGRQTDALREYRSFSDHLIEEAGLDPTTELRELEGRIAINDPALNGATRVLRGYELCERLGRGAFAVVHRAVQPGIQRDVAVKIIRSDLADRPEFVRRFEHEARLVASVEHPHVVPLYDYWREPGAAYLVMRMLRGGTVEDTLRKHGPFSRRAAIDLLEQVGGALESAHRKGVIHRDVRPANLLRDDEGVTYLADFGIALPAVAVDGSIGSTPEYASPELLRGEAVGVATDVLSLGITTFEILTGRLPFADSDSHAELIRRQLNDPLPSVHSIRTDLPRRIDEILARATAKAPDDRYSTVAALVSDLVGVLDESSTQYKTMPSPLTDTPDNPYLGLQAFDETHEAQFHGRSALITELAEALSAQPFVAVVGPSGSGKSSVVRAGLIPALRRGAITDSDDWLMTTMIPGSNPVDSLEVALLRVAVNPPASLQEQLREPGGLLRAIRRVLPSDDSNLLIVIDQLEELFTMNDPDEQQQFLTELAHAITAPDSPVRVVATLRADHYDVPLRHPSFADLTTKGTVTVRPMTPTELEQVIVSPARSVGVDVEPALVAELIAGIIERPAALPLLQFALTEAFERRTAGVMMATTHDQLGGLTGAVAARADRIVESGSVADQIQARLIFGRLVTLGDGVEDTRRRALRSEFDEGERTAWLLDAFASARLLTFDRDSTSREPTVEVAHEALLRDWPRLRGWLSEDRVDLRALQTISASASTWQRAGEDPSELVRGGRLAAYSELADRRPELLNATEAAWIAVSRAAADAEAEAERAAAARDRRQNRRLRQLLVAAAVLIVLAASAAAVAAVLRGRALDSEQAAVDSEQAAVEAAEDATVERIAALATSRAADSPDLAILLALEAVRRRDDPVTQTALLRSISDQPSLVSVFDDPLSEASFTVYSRDGRVAASRSLSLADGVVVWTDTETGEPIGEPFRPGSGIQEFALSTDGSTTVVALADGTVRTIGLDGRELGPRHPISGTPVGLALDRSGTTVLVVYSDFIEVVDVATGAIVTTYTPSETSAVDFHEEFAAALSDDGSFFVSEFFEIALQPDGVVLAREETAGYDIVDARTGELIERVTSAHVRSLSLSSTDTLAVGYLDGRVEVRALSTNEPPLQLRGFAEPIEAVGIHWDGSVGAASVSGLQVWSDDGTSILGPFPIGGTAVAVGFRPDAAALISIRGEGTLVADPGTSVMVDQAYPTDFSLNVFSDHPYYEVSSADGTTGMYRRLSDNEIVYQLPFSVFYPNGFGADPFYSSNGEFVLTAPNEVTEPVIMGGIDGTDPTAIDVVSAYEVALGETLTESFVFTPRPSASGDRMFLSAQDTTGGPGYAMWIDANTNTVVAGPLEIDAVGPPLALPDDRVVIGGTTANVQILPPSLDSPPLEVPNTEAFSILDQDENSGLVLVGGPSGEVGLVDIDNATVRRLQNATGFLRAGTFSPDGSKVVVLVEDGALQMLDVESGERIGGPMSKPGAVTRFRGIRWSADSTGIWVTTLDGPIRYAASPESWRAIACSIVNRELTSEEWVRFVSPTDPQVPACP